MKKMINNTKSDWTSWDLEIIQGPTTIHQILLKIKDKFDLKASHILCNGECLYDEFYADEEESASDNNE